MELDWGSRRPRTPEQVVPDEVPLQPEVLPEPALIATVPTLDADESNLALLVRVTDIALLVGLVFELGSAVLALSGAALRSLNAASSDSYLPSTSRGAVLLLCLLLCVSWTSLVLKLLEPQALRARRVAFMWLVPFSGESRDTWRTLTGDLEPSPPVGLISFSFALTCWGWLAWAGVAKLAALPVHPAGLLLEAVLALAAALSFFTMRSLIRRFHGERELLAGPETEVRVAEEPAPPSIPLRPVIVPPPAPAPPVPGVVSASPSCPRCARPVATRRCAECGAAVFAGDYVVQRLLSEMGQTRTYLAAAPSGEQVFLKELIFALVPDAKALEAFAREAELLKQLRHPRIPRYVANFAEGEGPQLRLYLAEEFVEGPSLLQEIETRRYSEAEAKETGLDLLGILTYLHERRPPILHRDLKPANMIRRRDGKLALVDFGSARDGAIRRNAGATQVGTLGYAPPEQLAGVATPGSDVYALAATLVHMLTRKAPWEYVTTGFDQSLRELRLSRPFTAWLKRALDPQPAKRFKSAVEAAEALSRQASPGRRLLLPVGAGLIAAVAVTALVVPKARQLVAPAPLVRPWGSAEDCPAGGFLGDDRPNEQNCMSMVEGKAVRNGVGVKFSADGGRKRVLETAHFKNDVLEGEFVSESPVQDGPRESGPYVAGKKHGVWSLFLGRVSKLSETTTWVDGKQTGPKITFSWEGTYAGKKSSEKQFVDGVQHGLTNYFHPNGKLKVTQTFVDGWVEGDVTEYYDDGTIMRTGTVVGRQPFGTSTLYFPNGKPNLIQEFKEGNVVVSTEFWPGGAKREEWKHEGDVFTRELYSEDGVKTVAEGSCEDKELVRALYCRLEYFPNGALKSRVGLDELPRMHDEVPVSRGLFSEWLPDGTLKLEGEQYHQRREGPWRAFWPNGKLMRLDEWRNGVQDGKEERYFENGRAELNGLWRQGKKTGVWVERAQDGRLLSKTDYDKVTP